MVAFGIKWQVSWKSFSPGIRVHVLKEFWEKAYRITRLSLVRYREPGQIRPRLIGQSASLLTRHLLPFQNRKHHCGCHTWVTTIGLPVMITREVDFSLLITIVPINRIELVLVGWMWRETRALHVCRITGLTLNWSYSNTCVITEKIYNNTKNV